MSFFFRCPSTYCLHLHNFKYHLTANVPYGLYTRVATAPNLPVPLIIYSQSNILDSQNAIDIRDKAKMPERKRRRQPGRRTGAKNRPPQESRINHLNFCIALLLLSSSSSSSTSTTDQQRTDITDI